MAFISNVKGVWTFNQSLEEESANNSMVQVGGTTPSYSQFQQLDLLSQTYISKYGLLFEAGIYYESSQTIVLSTNDIYIGFWWYSPAALGFTRHAVTRKLTPYVAPIIAKADTDAGSPIETVSNAQFIISEVGYSDTQNVIRFQISEGNGTPTHIFDSEPYEPGFHHIGAGYTRNATNTNSKIRIDIDGGLGTIYAWESSLAVADTNAKISLNRIYNGLSAHKTTQIGGRISDLVIFNNQGSSFDVSMKMVRFGWESITSLEDYYLGYTFLGVGYTQPATTTTNQIYAEGGNIYAARSDGEIRKGSRPIWDTEENFSAETQGKRLDGTTVRI